jgi:hypothetical protein
VAAERVEGAGWFIQYYEFGLAQEGYAQAEALLHPLGESAHLVVASLGEADDDEGAFDAALEAFPW